MSDDNSKDHIQNMLDFLNAPEDEYVISLDCSDCDKLAGLAERVANGQPVEAVLPALSEHLHYWRDCREEFEALVAILKAESNQQIRSALDEISRALEEKTQPLPKQNDEADKDDA
jgi:hypothetical protein